MEISKITSRPGADQQDQVVVKFASIRLRDEIKAMGRNLDGKDRKIGLQLEPPDHLRSHYQAFQKLAFQMKRRHPALRRSIKFCDIDSSLSMDVLVRPGAEWRTVCYEDAKSTLKKSRERIESIPRDELDDMADVGPRASRKKRRRTIPGSDKSDCTDEDNDVTIVDVDDDNGAYETKSKPCSPTVSFINANARSLTPKIPSLFDCFQSKLLDLAVVTETWLQDREIEPTRDLLSGFYSLGLVARNRETAATNGLRYGGVGLIFRKKTASFKEFALHNPDSFEVLASVGRVTGLKGKFFVVACYMPPNITPVRAKQNLEFISDVISEAKRKFRDCSLLVSGDFNQWPAEDILSEHPDLQEVPHGPTRDDRAIDRSFVNFGRSVDESGTLLPLESEEGNASDHKIAFARASFHKAPVKNITYTYKAYTETGATGFLQAIGIQDWSQVYLAESTSDKVEALQRALNKLMDDHFVTKTTTRRESDPPWFNDRIRWLYKKLRKLYDSESRSDRWKKLRAKINDLSTKRAEVYMANQKINMTGPNACRSFYKNIKAYSCREKTPGNFDIRDLFPEDDDGVVAEKVASHFNRISSEFKGLEPDDIPAARDCPLPVLTVDQVAKRLREIKKPKSMVRGDIFPSLVNRSSAYLALPLTNIFNCIGTTHEWPQHWKTEFVTPIPKKTLPENLDDLRNISCTQLLSKTYESFVLDWLTGQVKIRTNQYGGIKGSGSEHFLVDLWQRTLQNLEDPRAGVLFSSIDYSKAFNRLDFPSCLRSLKSKGASQQLINIIASFLTNRQMRVKVGDTLSQPKFVLGGVPQGSLLGVLLFNLTIDDFESHSTDVHDYNPSGFHNLQQRAPNPPLDSPVPAEPALRDYRHLPPWKTELLQILKYVDDNVIQEKINFDSLPNDGNATRYKHAVRTQNIFSQIVHEALSRGMKVNGLKTTAMVISELKAFVPRAFFFDTDKRRSSQVIR